MGLFDRLKSTLADNPTLRAVAGPVRDAEARAQAALTSLAEDARISARALAETFVEPEVVDAAIERAQQAASAIEAKEEEVCTQVAQSLSARTGVEVTTNAVKKTGRTLLAAVIAVEAADALGGLTGTEAVDMGGEAAPAPDGVASTPEVPPVLYDGMGNMDGTVTITDGGMAIDS